MNRYLTGVTKKELISSLNYIFPIQKVDDLQISEILEELQLTEKKRLGGQYLFWSNNKKAIVSVIYNNEKPKEVARGFLIKIVNKAQQLDLSFGNYFCKVFNDDIRMHPSHVSHSELWLSLRQTQFRRAIAKFSSFSTEPMIKWIQIIENSVSLKYENKPFSFCLFMTKQKEWIKNPLGNGFIKFSQLITFEKGIMSEKWLRGAMSGQTVGIAGYGLHGDLFGMFAIPTQQTNEKDTLFAPHEDIISITNLLVPGTCMFLTTNNGDIYFLLPNKSTFYKTQGRWYYLNFSNIKIVLTSLLEEEIASSILRSSLNLSFERKGALIFIPDTLENIGQIIPDYNQPNRANEILRKTIRGLKITDKIQRKIIISSAKADGALVVSQNGEILDVSCMIGQPNQSKLDELKINKLERFSGARSTAAWNASAYGTAIKISEDGPITIFRHGQLIAQVG